jgi:lipopolysaccharide transport system permease protein
MALAPDYTALAIAWRFAKKEFASRYRASLLGLGWYVVTPLVMVAVYTLVFFFIFQPKSAGVPRAAGPLQFAVELWAGLALFLAFSDLCVRASRVIHEQANLVRKVVFPLASLVLSTWMMMGFMLIIYLGLLFVLTLIAGITISTTWATIFPVLVIFFLNALGFAFVLAAVGAYIRDLGHLMPAALGMLMFLTPVFYQARQAPAAFQALLKFNPLTWPIEALRGAILHQSPPTANESIIYALASLAILGLGFAFFQRVRRGFADLL